MVGGIAGKVGNILNFMFGFGGVCRRESWKQTNSRGRNMGFHQNNLVLTAEVRAHTRKHRHRSVSPCAPGLGIHCTRLPRWRWTQRRGRLREPSTRSATRAIRRSPGYRAPDVRARITRIGRMIHLCDISGYQVSLEPIDILMGKNSINCP